MSNCRRVTDANINLSDCSTPREESPLSKRHRKQQQPKKIVSAAEIRVVRRSPKRRRKRQPVDFMSRLRDKHISYLIMRKGLRCFWCRSWSEVFPYHTISSLALHKLWHHRKDKFECEHCQVRYRHRYQVVLHASRAHLPKPAGEQGNESESDILDHKNVIELQLTQGSQFQNSVPLLVSHPTGVITSIHSERKDPNCVPDLPTELTEMSMKIPNFLSSLQDIQPSNQYSFRGPEQFSPKTVQEREKSDALNPQPEMKPYQSFEKREQDQSSVKRHQVLDTDVRQNIQELKPMIEMHGNNNTIPISEKGDQSSLIPNSQIQELIDSSVQGGSGPMPLVIPSYPPSG